MIVLFTDFGADGPYVGQLIAKIRMSGFEGDVVNLFSDAPAYSVQACARLLSAYMGDFPENSVFLCVVDPGLGSDRKALAVKANGRWFVGPDNGLFEYILRQDQAPEVFEIVWKPDNLSASFHGRDLFSPMAVDILHDDIEGKLIQMGANNLVRPDWPDDLAQIIYIDHFGNSMTGLSVSPDIKSILVGGATLPVSRTFSSVEKGAPLAYVNANGLIEIAINQGRADNYFSLSVGSAIFFEKS